MRKLLLLFVLLAGVISTTNVYADRFDYFWDTKAHDRGQIHMSYGYGFPRLDNSRFDFHKDKNNFRVVGVGPFIFKAEYGLTRELSVGISATYIKYRSDWQELRFDDFHNRDLWTTYGTVAEDLAIMLRFNYHYRVTPRSDLYIGGGMGYNMWTEEDVLPGRADDSTFNSFFKVPGATAAELTLGYRYYFRQRNAFYVEAGYGKSIVQAGFVFKFRHKNRE